MFLTRPSQLGSFLRACCCAALLCAVTLCTVAASAATLVQLSMSQMARQSTAIVRASVVSSSASFTGSTIYTHYKLNVTETWKGKAPAEFVVPGGIANGYRQSFPGAPSLQPGVEYVLFLWTSKAGITHIVGLTQGLFNLSTPTGGSLQATRQPAGETMLDSAGRQVQDLGLQMGLADLKAAVAQALGSAAGSLQ